MDKDDRDHFKTIGSALPAPQPGSGKWPNKASSESARVPEAYCLRRAEMMLSCYRRDDTHNPETYVAALAAVLGEYSREVIDYVTDPRTGIAATKTFLPSIAEVREALDAQMEKVHRMLTYEQRVAEQLRLRDEWKAQVPSERLKAAGRAWLDRTDPQAQQLSGKLPRRAYSEEEKAAFMASAKEAAQKLTTMGLSEETKALLREKACE